MPLNNIHQIKDVDLRNQGSQITNWVQTFVLKKYIFYNKHIQLRCLHT